MNGKSNSLLFELISYATLGTPLSDGARREYGEGELAELFNLANHHDLGHLVTYALQKNGMLPEGELSQKMQKSQFLAAYRYTRINYEKNRIYELLKEGEIPFMPLKGSVIRDYYPEPWMRTSCDIDVLVHREDLERAVDILTDKGGYTTDNVINYHDISLYSKGGVHLELHHNIKETMDNIDRGLERVWDYSVLCDEGEYRYAQTNEFLLFHQIAHMSYHFLHGGCGIRPFIDVCLLLKKAQLDEEGIAALMRECELDKFYESVKRLVGVWFLGEEHDEVTLAMEQYVLTGGVYGSTDNRVAAQNVKKGGKFKYLLSRIFIPYELIKYQFPRLGKHKINLPLMNVCRWFRLVFGGKFKKSMRDLEKSMSVDGEQSSEVTALLNNIGLI